eukprot:2734610-Rhodomonas_salina.1
MEEKESTGTLGNKTWEQRRTKMEADMKTSEMDDTMDPTEALEELMIKMDEHDSAMQHARVKFMELAMNEGVQLDEIMATPLWDSEAPPPAAVKTQLQAKEGLCQNLTGTGID